LRIVEGTRMVAPDRRQEPIQRHDFPILHTRTRMIALFPTLGRIILRPQRGDPCGEYRKKDKEHAGTHGLRLDQRK